MHMVLTDHKFGMTVNIEKCHTIKIFYLEINFCLLKFATLAKFRV